MSTLENKFVKIGWKYLHSIANGKICPNRSCLRCRLADVLFEVESKATNKPIQPIKNSALIE